MSVEIHQYLDNSGGNNFTENAPRPPVGPGEENELQSTGGHSNRSSSSHKSHASNKSSGSTGGATPRRLQKSAKLPPTTAVSAPPAGGTTEQVESDAPLGFEPEGSVDEKGEFTESGSPAYTKWQESLDCLLDDAEGVTLFKKFLTQENNLNLFEFYFAWKYLQTLEAEDTKEIASLVKTMYKVYIKGDRVAKRLTLVTPESKSAIAKAVSAKQYSREVFDSVKDQVVEVLKRDFYTPFLKSQIFQQYVQQNEESPKESAHSSGSVTARPLSTALPTVHEDSELDLKHLVIASDSLPADDAPVLTLTTKNVRLTERLRLESKIKPEEQAGYYLQRSKEEMTPPHPYHTYSASYLPISAIDSERQSLSSEALTDDTHSITDSSLDGFPQFTNKKSVQRYYKRIKNSAQRNPDSHLSNDILPPKTHHRMSKVSNLAETSPREFAKVLSDKLQKVLDEQNHKDMVRSKLSAMSEDEATTDDSHSVLSSTTGGAATNNTLNQLLVAIQAGDHDDEAQDILDMHCKRIWERSGQDTPAKSPSRSKSPDHHEAQSAKRQHIVPRQSMIIPNRSVMPPPYAKPAQPKQMTVFGMDSSYPQGSAASYMSSRSRHGPATFSSPAERQSIFKPPPAQTNNNQKVVEWISRNEEIMQHSSIHGQPDSDKSSFKRSQRSGSTSASPRTHRSKVHPKALGIDTKRLPIMDDKHSFKSKSSVTSSKDRRLMSRSVGESSSLGQQTLTQRKGVPTPPQIKVAFFLPDEPIPYSVTEPGTDITLARFKELITKKGNYRYFFKKATEEEFGREVPHVLEEITNDNAILPKWESKVVGHLKKVE